MSKPFWTPLHVQVNRVLQRRGLLPSGQAVLVAVSGGQDSLCLIQLLLDLQPRWHWQLAIAHCNHRWRPDAEANAAYIQQLAQQWQIPYYQETAMQGLPSEAAAREWRYQQLGLIAQSSGYSVLVTGHTASDRAETLLFNLVRGSGADGLQALTWQRSLLAGVSLVRPLLEVTRQETAAFCGDRHLQIWEDSTNSDLHYARNRMRQEVLPYLRAHFNPQVDRTLAQTAELLQADVACLEAMAAQIHQEMQHPEQPCLNRVRLRQQPLALQRRVIRHFLRQRLSGNADFFHINKVVELLQAPNRSQSDPLPDGQIVVVQGDWICLQSGSRPPALNQD